MKKIFFLIMLAAFACPNICLESMTKSECEAQGGTYDPATGACNLPEEKKSEGPRLGLILAPLGAFVSAAFGLTIIYITGSKSYAKKSQDKAQQDLIQAQSEAKSLTEQRNQILSAMEKLPDGPLKRIQFNALFNGLSNIENQLKQKHATVNDLQEKAQASSQTIQALEKAETDLIGALSDMVAKPATSPAEKQAHMAKLEMYVKDLQKKLAEIKTQHPTAIKDLGLATQMQELNQEVEKFKIAVSEENKRLAPSAGPPADHIPHLNPQPGGMANRLANVAAPRRDPRLQGVPKAAPEAQRPLPLPPRTPPMEHQGDERQTNQNDARIRSLLAHLPYHPDPKLQTPPGTPTSPQRPIPAATQTPISAQPKRPSVRPQAARPGGAKRKAGQ